MTAINVLLPESPLEKASMPALGGSGIQWPHGEWERSLTEMMSLSDWRRFVPESVVLLVVIVVAQTILPQGPIGLASLPHPFWIPVLLMSAQYGIMGGLFATLSATAAFFIGGLPAQSATQDFYGYAGIVAAQPCGWFGAALLLGGLRTLQIHHQTVLQERLDQTKTAAEDLADGLERAVGEVSLLEGRIATDSSTLVSFLHSLTKLELSDRQSLVASMADVIRFGVGATSFGIYLKGVRGFEPYLGIEDGSSVSATAIAPLAPSLLRQIRGGTPGALPTGNGARLTCPPQWAPIQLAGATEPVGIVVCNRLLPSQNPTIAIRRLNEVCRVLALLLPMCPETVSGV